jgi:hypothetical protein
MSEKKGNVVVHGAGTIFEHTHGPTNAKIVALGTVTLGGSTYMIDRDGQVEAGGETEFGVEHVGGEFVAPRGAWIANPDGKKLCEPVPAEGHENHWHLTVAPLYPVKKAKFVLQVGDEEAVVDFAPGAAPQNDGILSVFKAAHAPEWRGFFEIRLHGDAGDLEIWLFATAGNRTAWQATSGKPVPFDVPKETVIQLTFVSHEGKTIELRVRNEDKNEDEEGNPNMRDSGTNYFIFPGESGQDPEWLKGEEWRGIVTMAFDADGKSYASEPMVLVPHEAL